MGLGRNSASPVPAIAAVMTSGGAFGTTLLSADFMCNEVLPRHTRAGHIDQ